MVGIRLSLNKKTENLDQSNQKDKCILENSKFKVSKTPGNNKLPTKSVLSPSDNEDNDDEELFAIDEFNTKKGGAISKNKIIDKKRPLIIRPLRTKKDWKNKLEQKKGIFVPQEHQEKDIKDNDETHLKFGLNIVKGANLNQNVDITQRELSDDHEFSRSTDQKIRDAVRSGEDLMEESDLIVPKELSPDSDAEETTNLEYKEVPVDQFGAAFLRGMGWRHRQITSKPEVDTIVGTRKKSPYLGIGAIPADEDIRKDIDDSKTNFELPILKRKKESDETRG